jgi:FixJ family two-component response regulator
MIKIHMKSDSFILQEVVHIIDDDVTALAYATGVLDAAGIAYVTFKSAEHFLERVLPAQSGCVLLDLHLTGMDGIELLQAMRERGMHQPVVVLSGTTQVSSVVSVMKQDAFDFLEKPVDPGILVDAVQRALAFDRSERIVRSDMNLVRSRYETLSPRERQVMSLVIQGLANKQAAAELVLSEKTIEVHRSNVMKKMKVDSLPALVRAGLHCG